jgi:hypothetical protein
VPLVDAPRTRRLSKAQDVRSDPTWLAAVRFGALRAVTVKILPSGMGCVVWIIVPSFRGNVLAPFLQ